MRSASDPGRRAAAVERGGMRADESANADFFHQRIPDAGAATTTERLLGGRSSTGVWDALVEEVSVRALVRAHTATLNGGSAPPWIRGGSHTEIGRASCGST